MLANHHKIIVVLVVTLLLVLILGASLASLSSDTYPDPNSTMVSLPSTDYVDFNDQETVYIPDTESISFAVFRTGGLVEHPSEKTPYDQPDVYYIIYLIAPVSDTLPLEEVGRCDQEDTVGNHECAWKIARDAAADTCTFLRKDPGAFDYHRVLILGIMPPDEITYYEDAMEYTCEVSD